MPLLANRPLQLARREAVHRLRSAVAADDHRCNLRQQREQNCMPSSPATNELMVAFSGHPPNSVSYQQVPTAAAAITLSAKAIRSVMVCPVFMFIDPPRLPQPIS